MDIADRSSMELLSVKKIYIHKYIGMEKLIEKLIELLNKYDKPVDEDERVYSEYSWNFLRGEREDMERMSPEKLCGKKFWFIKWLVDNDKIDLDKLKDNISFTMLTHSIWLWCEWHTAHEWESILKAIWTNAIIAYLSIQDNSLEFLISILK